MLKDVGMAVPNTRETRTIYMQQERGWWHAIVIPCVTTNNDNREELRMVLLLHVIIPCLVCPSLHVLLVGRFTHGIIIAFYWYVQGMADVILHFYRGIHGLY